MAIKKPKQLKKAAKDLKDVIAKNGGGDISVNGKKILEVPAAKKGKAKQGVIDLETGEISEVDADMTGIGDDHSIDDEPERESQAKIVADITGIVLKPSQRIVALKVSSPKMIDSMTRIYKDQRAFMMKFKVPVESENGKVLKWEDVEFETRLNDISLKAGKATCHFGINHKGACQMSDLILNWNGPVQFFLDGIQQSLF